MFKTVLDGMHCRLRGGRGCLFHPHALLFREGAQHIRNDVGSTRWTPDADANTAKGIRSQRLYQRYHTVVPARRTARTQFELTGWKIHIVVYHQDVLLDIQFVKADDLGSCNSAYVHIRLRFHEQNWFPRNPRFADE